MKRIYILILVLIGVCGSVMAADDAQRAAAAYNAGRYQDAVALYETMLKRDGSSAALYANLGNAYIKAGDYGKGMLAYERSLRLDPTNKMVRNNKAFVESRVQDNNKAEVKGRKISVTPDEKSFFSNIKSYITTSHSTNTWAVSSGVFFILFCGCVALYLFLDGVLIRKVGFFGGMATLALSLILLIFAFMTAGASTKNNEGVVTGFKVTLLADPIDGSKTVGFPLNRGTVMDVLNQETETGTGTKWLKVRLNSDYVGWIKAADFEVI